MNALGTVQQASANNVANVSTDGFEASRVNLESGYADQGVQVASITKDTSAGAIFDGREMSNVDIGREMVGMMTTENAYSANATAIRTGEEMSGYLLNMMV